jgi:hypothetical protein
VISAFLLLCAAVSVGMSLWAKRRHRDEGFASVLSEAD